jgi:hypothetical protein
LPRYTGRVRAPPPTRSAGPSLTLLGVRVCVAAQWVADRSLIRPDVGPPDHLAPFFSLVSDESAEVSGRDGKWNVAQVGKPYLHLGICEHRTDLVVEPVDDLGGGAPGHPDTGRGTCLKTGT